MSEATSPPPTGPQPLPSRRHCLYGCSISGHQRNVNLLLKSHLAFERAGQKNNLKETSRGHLVCVKKTNNVKKGAWLFFPIFHLLNFVERLAKYSTYLYKGSCQVFGFTYVSLVIVFGTKGSFRPA